MNILAIDPGASGGLAWTDNEGTHCLAMPPTDGDILDLLRSIKASGCDRCVIEQVGGYAGGVGQPGSAMFRFGETCGFIRGCLMALSFRVEMVRPQKWQKHFSLGNTKQAGGKTAWKNKLKAEAQRRFPEQTVTLKTADSLLILDYAVTTTREVVK
jgi:hypothetical protein